jgi:2,4-dienoyl-CoA reductase-like NADH-dependent reductase (Old Yellow Enzyme family)
MSAQLHHPGLFTMSSTGSPMGPSFFWLPSKLKWPRSMGPSDLKEVKEQFVEAARMCLKAGFDCIELHCGHGYLLSQFLTPMINRRWDKYGGSPEKRARFPCEIMEGIRNVVGKQFPILIKMNVDDGVPFGGLRLDQAVIIAKKFADAGVDGIIPSFGYTSLNGFGMLRGNVPMDKMVEALPTGANTILKYAGRFLVPSIEFESIFLRKDAQAFITAVNGTGTKIVYIGGADSMANIEAVLADGAEAIQLGRPLIREPFFVKKMAHALSRFQSSRSGKNGTELGDDDREILEVKSRCIRCNMCTLASMDPTLFKVGCPFAKVDDGIGIEDIEDITLLMQPAL